jgi:hypothetical protein
MLQVGAARNIETDKLTYTCNNESKIESLAYRIAIKPKAGFMG